MTMEQTPTIAGIVVSGADDALYFIPDADLAAYRLADEAAAQVRQALEQQDDTQGYYSPATLQVTQVDLSHIGSEAAVLPVTGRAGPGTTVGQVGSVNTAVVFGFVNPRQP